MRMLGHRDPSLSNPSTPHPNAITLRPSPQASAISRLDLLRQPSRMPRAPNISGPSPRRPREDHDSLQHHMGDPAAASVRLTAMLSTVHGARVSGYEEVPPVYRPHPVNGMLRRNSRLAAEMSRSAAIDRAVFRNPGLRLPSQEMVLVVSVSVSEERGTHAMCRRLRCLG
jgi:hypothetical protein